MNWNVDTAGSGKADAEVSYCLQYVEVGEGMFNINTWTIHMNLDNIFDPLKITIIYLLRRYCNKVTIVRVLTAEMRWMNRMSIFIHDSILSFFPLVYKTIMLLSKISILDKNSLNFISSPPSSVETFELPFGWLSRWCCLLRCRNMQCATLTNRWRCRPDHFSLMGFVTGLCYTQKYSISLIMMNHS